MMILGACIYNAIIDVGDVIVSITGVPTRPGTRAANEPSQRFHNRGEGPYWSPG